MNNAQTQAWTAATNWNGATPNDLKILIVGILIAVAFVWGAAVVRKLGFEVLSNDFGSGIWRFVMYGVRVLLILILLVWLVS